MDIGMLWFDNDPKTEIASKIERAATYYRNKYGKTPNVCFVHPSMVGGNHPQTDANTLKSGNILVRTSPAVMPHHFWIGINGTTS